jgi:hypothetical protein
MPATLSFFDMEVNLPAAQNVDDPVDVTLGPNWQPGDIRCFYQLWYQPQWNYQASAVTGGGSSGSGNVNGSGTGSGSVSVPSTPYFASFPVTVPFSAGFSYNWNWPGSFNTSTAWYGPNILTQPAGFSALAKTGSANQITLSYSLAYRRLLAGDADTFITYGLPAAMNYFATLLFTVRGVDPSWTPSGSDWGFLSNPNGAAVNVCSSVSVPGQGTMALICSSYPTPTGNSSQPTWSQAQYTGFSIGCPTGWTNLVATSGSGDTFFQYNSQPAAIAVAKSFSGPTSTGTITFEAGSNSNPEFAGIYVWFQPAADVSNSTGSATTHTTATAATHSSSNTVINATGDAFTTSSATTAFNEREGYWVSDPLPLTGQPVTGSAVRWNAITPIGSSVMVETSINNGLSWDTAANDGAVPRLREGDITTRSVLARVSLTRNVVPTLYPGPAIFPSNSLFPNGSPPKVTFFELDVSTDASVTELVPIGMGMIDDVTTHATGGTTGSGASTNVAGSTAVIGQGGGQTGGGIAIKCHVNDLSYAIKRNVWQMPYTVPGGILYTDAIQAMVLDRLPSQTAFNLSTTTRVTPLLVYGAQQGGDPWQDMMELAGAIGFEIFFDPTGVFVCRPVPDPTLANPVWQFDETAVQLVAEATRDLSSDQTFNDIVVVGQSTSTQNPFSAEAYDDNPSSPTYILGPYGRVAQRLTFSQITSQDQAQDTAQAALNASLGAADTVTLTCVPMPALEPGDIVKVVCGDVKVDGTYMVNSMTTPLSPADPQTLTCFRQSTSST